MTRAEILAAVEGRADLAGATLAGADLAGADLAGAYLARAYLAGVRDVLSGGFPDGLSAFAWHRGTCVMVHVGSVSYSLDEARDYWCHRDDGREILAFLGYAEAIAAIREWR